LLNFRSAVLSGLVRRQPCFALQDQLNKNFSAHWVCEFKKSKFFARQGKSAVNTDVLTSILTHDCDKFAFLNRVGFDSLMPIQYRRFVILAQLHILRRHFPWHLLL